MKDAWSEENDKIEFTNGPVPAGKPYRPTLLSGLSSPPSRETIMESLPSREAADKLVGRFFESYTPSVPATCKCDPVEIPSRHLHDLVFVHKATFLKQVTQLYHVPMQTLTFE
jgi:hypothetical protein